uniref:Metalloendopeptidase n=1 Tax=Magallana gigas TaxID=29159 RepID=K1PN08_MAGGI
MIVDLRVPPDPPGTNIAYSPPYLENSVIVFSTPFGAMSNFGSHVWCVLEKTLKDMEPSFVRDVVSQGDRRRPPVGATIDQLIARSMGGIEGYINISNQLVTPDSKILAELDMYLTYDQYKILYSSERERTKRKAVRSGVLRWPSGEIPYEFKWGAYSNSEKYLIRVAMREWENCNSQLGMVGGGQPLNLDRNGCRYKGLYLHEIGHAVGLVHEHQRPIRDQFIRINYGNVHPSLRQWFQKYPQYRINNFNISYEFSSVMHYGITAFSVDGRSKTIETQPQYRSQEPEIGRVYSKELSFTDIATVNNIPEATDLKLVSKCISEHAHRHCSRNIRCRDGGYVDQNCRCVCPDGSSDCEEGKAPQFQCRNQDKDWSCSVWAKQGECDRNPRYMKSKCARACGVCSDAMAADKVVGDQCVNAFPDDKCKSWKELGDCVANKVWMSQNCKKACGVCDSSNDSTGTGCSNRQPDKKCDDWAVRGECTVNPRWMARNCQKSTAYHCRYNHYQRRESNDYNPMAVYHYHQSTVYNHCIYSTDSNYYKITYHTETGISKYTVDEVHASSEDKHLIVFASNHRLTPLPKMATVCSHTLAVDSRLLPKAPVISVIEVTPDLVRFQVSFRGDDGSTLKLLVVKPFQRELKYKNYPIELTDGGPRVIEVKYSGLKPKSAYSFRFYAISDAGSGQYIDEKIMTKAKEIAVTRSTCGNKYPDEKCQRLETKWKFCRVHRLWMSKNCKETCGLCPIQRDEATTGRTGDPNCQDADKYCRDWSRFGHCQSNASYMLKYCKAACRVCTPTAV